MRDHRRAPRGGGWPDVVVRLVVALLAGGFASWYVYGSVTTWVPLAFLAAFLGADGWRVTTRLRPGRRHPGV